MNVAMSGHYVAFLQKSAAQGEKLEIGKLAGGLGRFLRAPGGVASVEGLAWRDAKLPVENSRKV